MLLDMGVKFFLQELDEDGLKSKQDPLHVIANRYFRNGFGLDLIALVPFPMILQYLLNS